MIPLVLTDAGEEVIIRLVGGSPEMKKHQEDMLVLFLMASFRRPSSTDASERKLASPFVREAETFFAEGMAFRIVLQICASHIGHIMPSIFNVVLNKCLSSFLIVRES